MIRSVLNSEFRILIRRRLLKISGHQMLHWLHIIGMCRGGFQELCYWVGESSLSGLVGRMEGIEIGIRVGNMKKLPIVFHEGKRTNTTFDPALNDLC